jgi:hypothetical protein
MQDNTTAHTVNNSVDALAEILGKRVMSWRLWPPQSPTSNPGDFLHVGPTGRKKACEQSTLFGRA